MKTASAPEPASTAAAREHAQRLVLRVDAEDRERGVATDVSRHRREQPRLARLGVGLDRHVVDGDQQLARLDDRLQRVGELRDRLHLQGRFAVVGPEARGGVRYLGARRLAHHPGAQPLQPALGAGEVLVGSTCRSPITMSASPRRIGATSLGMSPPSYWLSASVLTITSAPSLSPASSPAWKPAASPLWLVSRTM